MTKFDGYSAAVAQTKIRLLLAGALLFVTLGCHAPSETATVTVAVAASAVPIAEIVRGQVGEDRPEMIVLTQGASGNLARQAIHGAPFDVFVSADRARIAELREAQMVVRTGVYARGRLVAIFSSKIETPIETDDAMRHQLRNARVIAIANPSHAPYGIAAEQYLERLGVLEEVRGRLLLTENVGQIAQTVRTGNADVGLAAASLVLDFPDAVSINESNHDPIEQEAALLTRGEANPKAVAFYEALFSEATRNQLPSLGYGVPP